MKFTERDGLARQRLDENLHATAQAKHQVERALLLDVVVGQGAPVLELLARKDKTLLIWRDALLVLDLGLDVLNAVRGLDLCVCMSKHKITSREMLCAQDLKKKTNECFPNQKIKSSGLI